MIRKFSFIQLNLVALSIAVLVTAVCQLFVWSSLQNWLYLAISFFFTVNLVIYYIFIKNNKNSRAAVNNVMISSIIRLFSSILFIIGYFLVTENVDKASVVFFLFYYFLFMAFEIYFLVYKLRPQNQG